MHWRIFPAGTRNQLEQDQAPESLQGAPSMVPVLGHQVEVVDSFINRPRIMYWTRWWEWYGYPQTNRTSPHMQEGTEPWNLAHVYLIVNQASFVQYIIYEYILPVLLYGADTWSMTVASTRRLDMPLTSGACNISCTSDSQHMLPIRKSAPEQVNRRSLPS